MTFILMNGLKIVPFIVWAISKHKKKQCGKCANSFNSHFNIQYCAWLPSETAKKKISNLPTYKKDIRYHLIDMPTFMCLAARQFFSKNLRMRDKVVYVLKDFLLLSR